MRGSAARAGVGLLILAAFVTSKSEAPPDSRNTRHADGYFTSQLSKLRTHMAALKALGLVRRSNEEQTEATDGLDRWRNEFCINWLQEKVLTGRFVEAWAGREMEVVAAEVLCPVFTQMMRDMGRGELWSKTIRPWM